MEKSSSEHIAMQTGNIQEVLDSASMGIWRITMREGMHPRFAASKKTLELMGMAQRYPLTEEELYDEWYKRIPPEYLDSVHRSLEKMQQGGRDENTYQWMHPTLGMRYVRCGGICHKEDDGTIIAEGYHYDVTDQELEHMQTSLVVKALANIYAGVFYVDLQHRLYTAYLNDIPILENHIRKSGKVEEVFNTLTGLEANRFYLPKWNTVVREFLDMETLEERMKYNQSISIQFEGTVIPWVKLSILVSDRDRTGKIHHVVVTVLDISEQKKKEVERASELKQNIDANRSKTMMLQNMTHEIRTPLNAMFGFSQLLSLPEGSITDEQKTEYFNYIYNSFNMLSMLIDDVMDIADAEHGNYRIQKTTVEVNKVCRNALQMAELRLPAGVELKFTSDVADDYTVLTDGRRVQQLLVNYLTNACKHTRKGEIRLNVSTEETPGRLTFSVADTGEGVPEDMRKDIFERYKKANSNVQGSGIGLHICKLIAEKLGGEIKLDEDYTEGSRFLFII